MYLFLPGIIVATPAAIDAFDGANEDPSVYFNRHLSGDWGDLDESDKIQNEIALQSDARILSAYNLADGSRIWIITEADRSSTCLLLPSDY
jgi:hypothetical protein